MKNRFLITKGWCEKNVRKKIDFLPPQYFRIKKCYSTKTFNPFLRFINESFIFEEKFELSVFSNEFSATYETAKLNN